ncbi:transcriptional regulator [Treponema parvum]|uniref:Transcriptional regulator n=1 Tax=Treponema parvum TaxID=138851 RepID=A0A975F391_9SPIR|nr:transcriptional regulator [Treponema parvum]QTQ13835.1 transcriptional regulator [Treponema parvum]
MNDMNSDHDFSKAYNKALVHEIQSLLNPGEASLISFADVKELLKPQNESYEGIKTVPVASIVGSEDRYRDFDKEFFPKNLHLKSRWESIDNAINSGITLPPINLYEVGGLYFVRDGNHRVSVAKAQGIEFIDAEVVSLKTEIKLKPGQSYKKIKKQVINYEKRVFYSETAFGDITDYWCLDFSAPGQYDVIYNHILAHKNYMNQNHAQETGMPDVIMSWYTSVYTPIIQLISKKHILKRFPGRTQSDLYVWFIKYWDELKKKFGEDYALDKTVTEFSKKYGMGFFQRLKNIMEHLSLKK